MTAADQGFTSRSLTETEKQRIRALISGTTSASVFQTVNEQARIAGIAAGIRADEENERAMHRLSAEVIRTASALNSCLPTLTEHLSSIGKMDGVADDLVLAQLLDGEKSYADQLDATQMALHKCSDQYRPIVSRVGNLNTALTEARDGKREEDNLFEYINLRMDTPQHDIRDAWRAYIDSITAVRDVAVRPDAGEERVHG